MATLRWVLCAIAIIAPTVRGQTCYVSAGVEADSSVVPCGSSGVSACCQLGDICLSDSACFNYTTSVTYLYGCTDSSYSDEVCPWKCGSDYTSAPYVGITYCSDPGNLWSCTKPPNDSPIVVAQPDQACTSDSQVAFAGGAVLDPILALPLSVGGSTGYYSTINPTSFTEIAGYTPAQIPANVVPSKPTTPEQVVPPTTHASTKSKTTKRSTTAVRTTAVKTTPSATPISVPSTTPSRAPTTPSTTPSLAPTTPSSTPSIAPTTPSTTPSSAPSTTPSSTQSSTLSTAPSSTPSSISFTSSSTPTSQTSTTGQSSSSSTTVGSGGSSSTPTPVPNPGGLSTGAKIGIGVGVAGGVLFVLALLLFGFMWRRRKRTHEPVPQSERPYSVPYNEPKTGYQDHPPVIPPVGGVENRSELPGDEPARGNKHWSNQSELDSSTRHSGYGDSPAPTYVTNESTPRIAQRPVHEIGTNF